MAEASGSELTFGPKRNVFVGFGRFVDFVFVARTCRRWGNGRGGRIARRHFFWLWRMLSYIYYFLKQNGFLACALLVKQKHFRNLQSKAMASFAAFAATALASSGRPSHHGRSHRMLLISSHQSLLFEHKKRSRVFFSSETIAIRQTQSWSPVRSMPSWIMYSSLDSMPLTKRAPIHPCASSLPRTRCTASQTRSRHPWLPWLVAPAVFGRALSAQPLPRAVCQRSPSWFTA